VHTHDQPDAALGWLKLFQEEGKKEKKREAHEQEKIAEQGQKKRAAPEYILCLPEIHCILIRKKGSLVYRKAGLR
jgi:hypothetical protein